jgi:hypothetical protein
MTGENPQGAIAASSPFSPRRYSKFWFKMSMVVGFGPCFGASFRANYPGLIILSEKALGGHSHRSALSLRFFYCALQTSVRCN